MAINTNELRIGNYLYWDYMPDNVMVTSIDTMQVSLDRSERAMIDIEDLDPIRLTKDWLINFGFECDNDNQFAIDMEGYNWTIRLHDGLIGLDYNEYHPTKSILYVHELQNLYFAITGKELVKINSAMDLTDNELIAQFMGLPLTKEMPEFGTGNWKEVPFQKWKYHESWDWLMDVVDKIERLGNRCEIGIAKCKIYSADYNVEPTYGATKIQAVYNAVVDYIKWHNSERGS